MGRKDKRKELYLQKRKRKTKKKTGMFGPNTLPDVVQQVYDTESYFSEVYHSCSQCSFTAQFESALLMHHQLHHESPILGYKDHAKTLQEQSGMSPIKMSPPTSPFTNPRNKGLKMSVARSPSAAGLLGKLKARICKSRTLFAHPEMPESKMDLNNLSLSSECTSKALKVESTVSLAHPATAHDRKETYACHLCSFDADRITVLDRHLLNDHKIGLENLLKLVMAKTKDGLSEESNPNMYGIRQPYYRAQNEMIQEGEFIIETVTPQIKILKHASTNTEDMKDFSLETNCQMISKEIESLLSGEKQFDNQEFMLKMKTLNDCMCKFVDSSNTLKKVLTKELDSKINVKEHCSAGDAFFNMVLERDTPRKWERAHSEKMERNRNKYGDPCRSEKTKPSESFYF